MLTPYRRHKAECRHTSRKYRSCGCPIWVQGTLRGESIRESLDLTNWEAAHKLLRDWEIHGKDAVVSASDALDRWIEDCEARNLSSESMRKYKRLKKALALHWGHKSLKVITVDEVRKLRESWTFAPGTISRQLELVRTFFAFCVD